MNNFVSVLRACQSAGGAGKKDAIKAALSIADADTRALIWHALNPYLTYGVRKWEKPTTFHKDGYCGVGQFLDLLQALSSRSLTGNEAQAAVTSVLSLYTAEQAEFLELVIEKDLKSGFSEDTFNKVWTGKDDLYGTIPTFEVMLADKCESDEEFADNIAFPCLADFKYDGQRNIAIVENGVVRHFARSGKPSDHLSGLSHDAELIALSKYLGTDIAFDCEAFAGDFTETINAKKSGNDKAKAAIKLRAFFVMPLSDWRAQKTTITMATARQTLIDALEAIGAKYVIVSDAKMIYSFEEMKTWCNEVIDVHKQEGLILKRLDAVYKWKRSIDWCKVKRFYDVDARITGFYMGRKKSRLENTVGGINIEGTDEKGRKFKCNCGSGFSDEMRKYILENWDKVEGATAVITYQEISLAKGSEFYALRFPTFNHIRDDKIVPAL